MQDLRVGIIGCGFMGRTHSNAYRRLNEAMRRMPESDLWVSPFDIKLIGEKNPITRDVLDFLSKFQSPIARRYPGTQLGSISIDEAYVYPRQKAAIT